MDKRQKSTGDPWKPVSARPRTELRLRSASAASLSRTPVWRSPLQARPVRLGLTSRLAVLSASRTDRRRSLVSIVSIIPPGSTWISLSAEPSSESSATALRSSRTACSSSISETPAVQVRVDRDHHRHPGLSSLILVPTPDSCLDETGTGIDSTAPIRHRATVRPARRSDPCAAVSTHRHTFRSGPRRRRMPVNYGS